MLGMMKSMSDNTGASVIKDFVKKEEDTLSTRRSKETDELAAFLKKASKSKKLKKMGTLEPYDHEIRLVSSEFESKI